MTTDVHTQVREAGLQARPRWVPLVVGCGLSGLLAYLAVGRIQWGEVLNLLGDVQYRFLALAALGTAATVVLRAWRWRVILGPVKRVRWRSAVSVTAVGFLAIIVVPFRVGELARPLLLSDAEGVPFTTGLATIAVERCLDGLAFAALIALAAPWLPLPAWVTQLGYLMGAGYLLVLTALGWAWLARASCLRVVGRVIGWIAPARGQAIAGVVDRFVHGLSLLPDGRRMGAAGVLSAAIWLLGTAVNFVSFGAIQLAMPWVAAAALQIFITVGVLLPAAPGFVGSFQFFAVAALGLFGVREATALSYAILVHATVLLTHLLLGVGGGLLLQVGWWRRCFHGSADWSKGPATR